MPRFEYDLPVWAVVDPTFADDHAGHHLIAVLDDGSDCTPWFTDEDLADRFIAESGRPLKKFALLDNESARRFLVKLKSIGATHVIFDANRPTDGRGRVSSIDGAIAHHSR